MGKVLLFLSLISIAILGLGTHYAHNDIMFSSLSSGASLYQVARLVLGLVLVIQITTRPPRHMIFRFIAGSIALSSGSWAIYQTFGGNMMFLDSMAFIGTSFAIFATTLERSFNIDNYYELPANKAERLAAV